ncbi:MAG: DNA-directed RNA polymerase subunit beta' [Candidatus Nomurabacteria bacterium]|jgi:DNA-directed RNA polymerase subunit beta'|nr:DNA-directed RNA polymerase subunit beta' [Candidatus Nomurabacteria bacterium]
MNFYQGDQDIDFDAIRLTVAGPDDILSWSYGEVLKPETINYRTQKPERDGLFCERIFGPTKDLNPHDTKLKGVRARDAAVDRNGNLVTKSVSRRERMGHIKLAVPVTHDWFLRVEPAPISALLGMQYKSRLRKIVAYQTYVILAVDEGRRDEMLADNENRFEAGKAAISMRYKKAAGDKNADTKELAKMQTKELDDLTKEYETVRDVLGNLVKGALVSEQAYRNMDDEFVELIEVGMGGEAICRLLGEVDIDELIADLTTESQSRKGQARAKVQKRLRIVEGIKKAGIDPTSLCLTCLPVIPPGLRPMVQLTGGRFATSDINDLYRRVINRNNRLKKLIALGAPEVIQRNEKRMLQEAVDKLIYNTDSSAGNVVTSTGGRRALKSLSEALSGKQGSFRQNLLGKRVDFSGRSVIVSGPELKLDECGIPKQMALELFRPFIVNKLLEWEEATNFRGANNLIERGVGVVWDALDEVIQNKYVLLNRAPSLHRLSVQAFKPKVISGKAIQLSLLVTGGFNADFDGDQMAVHLPLSDEAQAEARDLMSARNNLLKPSDGSPTLSISQDILFGCYYLTYEKQSAQVAKPKAFASLDEAILARDNRIIDLQTNIILRYKGENRETTLGRAIFNNLLPEDFPYVNEIMSKKPLERVLARIFNHYGDDALADLADEIKALGFKYATRSGATVGMTDYFDIDDLEIDLMVGDDKVRATIDAYSNGLITDRERHIAVRKAWNDARDNISKKFDEKIKNVDTGIALAVNSGARGSVSNVVDVSGMIGTVNATYNVSAKKNLDKLRMSAEIELPVRSNLKNGLSPLEMTIAARGSRKGLIDTALNTAKSGYLTRRLVDVAQDVFTVDDDEELVDPGFTIYRDDSEFTKVNFQNRLFGRFAAENVGKYVKAGELITVDIAAEIENDEKVSSVKIMSVLSTPQVDGVPRKSYGIDMTTGYLISAHEPVGVIAAQSVGEPATQLTLDNKHGAGEEDVTEGLPRLEELLELYGADIKGGKLKVSNVYYERKYATLSEIDGKVKVKTDKNNGRHTITVTGSLTVDGEKHEAEHVYASNNRLVVKTGDKVQRGDRLTEGSIYPPYLMELKDEEAAKRYILNEILRLYAGQGYNTSTKHFEIIVAQMFSRVRVIDPGDSELIIGAEVSKITAKNTNDELLAAGKKPAQVETILQGVKRISSASDSFLSSVSFQATIRELNKAAIRGAIDYLRGLKENVIIGRKIPVGTGAIQYPAEDFGPTDYDLENV